ncbi:MAG: cold shock domain-containing protein [Halobacteriovoraceae bacterium]|nr:cold shock domain-containing protein [Halobacteriovoraceae bacterium]
MKWKMGEVSWFNDGSGEGVIRAENGKNYYVHYSAIDSNKKRKTLKQNQKVKVQVLDDEFARHVTKLSMEL